MQSLASNQGLDRLSSTNTMCFRLDLLTQNNLGIVGRNKGVFWKYTYGIFEWIIP